MTKSKCWRRLPMILRVKSRRWRGQIQLCESLGRPPQICRGLPSQRHRKQKVLLLKQARAAARSAQMARRHPPAAHLGGPQQMRHSKILTTGWTTELKRESRLWLKQELTKGQTSIKLKHRPLPITRPHL